MFLSINLCKAQDGPYLGGQIGYSWCKSNYFELAGINAYYIGGYKPFHIFGPAVILTGIGTPEAFYVRTRFSFNYSFCPGAAGVGFRISPAFEFNHHGDRRFGFDIGASALGLYPYVGFYWPVGSFASPDISTFRFGIRYVFNIYFNGMSMSDLTN